MSRQPTPNVLDMVLGPASAELSPLTTWESGRLAHLEGVIEAGLQTFYDVGGALMEIREGRLYRQTHRSFEAYTKERWGMGKSRAHQLIEAASTVAAISGPVVAGEPSTMVDTLPTNERQVRALSGLDDQTKREVWAEAVHAAPDSKPTARLVQEVRQRRERPVAIVDVEPSRKPSTMVDSVDEVDGGGPAAKEMYGGGDMPPLDRKDELRMFVAKFEGLLGQRAYLDGSLLRWGDLTGRHSETSEAERGLRKLLAITRRELAILEGQTVPEGEAWGEL